MIALDDIASDVTEPDDGGPARRYYPVGAGPWQRWGLVALLLGTAAAYLLNIGVNGMGNNFYAASAWAGSRSWKALLFGSLDPNNFITVDKPPVSQWVMGLFGRIFGFSSASVLVPEALMGVASVALVYATVTRATSARGAGLPAGTALAVTPVAALMFRFDNPDAAMVLLMTAAAYCLARALPEANPRWLALAGVATGFAFLAKMLEGLMVVPALALTYLIVAPTTLWIRIRHAVLAAVVLAVSAGWYVVLTVAWPVTSRPYMAGSTDNSFMNLVVGYNGFSRFLGHNHRGNNPFELPPGFSRPGSDGSGGPGLTRLFTDETGFEISWLLPAALLALILILVERGRAPRTDTIRGVAVLFGLWMIIDGASLSTMKGHMHAYYSLSIAPAVAGVLGMGVWLMWRRRAERIGALGTAGLVLCAGVWGFILLDRNSSWQPWLRGLILVVSVATALGLVAGALTGRAARMVTPLAMAGVLAGMTGATAYTVATLPVSHTGGGPEVGPEQPDSDDYAGRMANLNIDGSTSRLDGLLRRSHTLWSGAVERSASAAALELSSRTPVIAIGGFGQEDPVPTLAQFTDYVRRHEIGYYIAVNAALPDSWRIPGAHTHESGVHRPGPGGWWPGMHSDIAEWVATHYHPENLGKVTVYKLT